MWSREDKGLQVLTESSSCPLGSLIGVSKWVFIQVVYSFIFDGIFHRSLGFSDFSSSLGNACYTAILKEYVYLYMGIYRQFS